MWQNLFNQFALLIGLLLCAVVFPVLGFAQYPDNSGGDLSGTMPMAPMSAPPNYDNVRRVVPGPPMQPTVVSRPQSWPGGSIQTSSYNETYPSTTPGYGGMPNNPTLQNSSLVQAGLSAQYPQTSMPPIDTVPQSSAMQVPQEPPMELFEGTLILARVGSEAIFAYEIMGGVNEVLERYKDKIPPDQLEMQRTMLIKQRLRSRIESKLIYQDVKRTIPAEGIAEVEKKIANHWDSTELPKMAKRAGVESTKELDQKLRSMGSSLDRERASFIERTLAQQWVRQQVKPDEEITYDQMMKYYREHTSEFEKPAKAKWEELMACFSKYSSREEAYNAIAQLGNQVLAGAEFAEVAKNASDGATSSEGGMQDWTTKGSLVCKDLDVAIFGLPIGQVSQIIESKNGYHIVRVTERVDDTVTPFLSAQVEIKEKISQQRLAKQLKEYLDKLEDKIPIWTVYDGDQRNLRLADRFKDPPR